MTQQRSPTHKGAPDGLHVLGLVWWVATSPHSVYWQSYTGYQEQGLCPPTGREGTAHKVHTLQPTTNALSSVELLLVGYETVTVCIIHEKHQVSCNTAWL